MPVVTVETIHELASTAERRFALTVAVLVAAVAATELLRRIGPRLKQRAGDTAVEFAQTLAVAAVWSGAIWLLVVTWRASGQVTDALAVLDVGETQLVLGGVTVVILVGAYFLTRLSKRWVHRFAEERSAVSGHERQIAHHVVQFAVFVAAGLVVLSLWSIPIGNLLLGAGFLGIVLGLAARQTLGAMLAGFVVLLSRPFEIGEWVQIGENEGIVTDITVFNTRIQTFDGEYLMVPNDLVTAAEIVNRSRRGRLRIEVEVGVDYDTDVEEARAVAREALEGVDTVLSSPGPRVVCKRFDESAIVLGLRFWIDDPSARRRWDAQTAVVQSVAAAFDEAGITVPFPQRELSGRDETDGLQVTATSPEASGVADGEQGVDGAEDEETDGAEDEGSASEEDGANDGEADDGEVGDGEADDGEVGDGEADDGETDDGERLDGSTRPSTGDS